MTQKSPLRLALLDLAHTLDTPEFRKYQPDTELDLGGIWVRMRTPDSFIATTVLFTWDELEGWVDPGAFIVARLRHHVRGMQARLFASNPAIERSKA